MQSLQSNRQHLPHAVARSNGGSTPQLAVSWHWLADMLDEIDYGMLLVDENGALLHANHAGQSKIAPGEPLAMEGNRVVPQAPCDAAAWDDALAAAAGRRQRRLVGLGCGAKRLWAAFTPLALGDRALAGAVSVVLSRSSLCAEISAYSFARTHGLTAAESKVLADLCDGLPPAAIARKHGVAVSTVRTQVSSIRAKTHALSIGSLVRQVALLPPLMNVLRLQAAV